MEYRGRQFAFDESVRLGSGGMAEVYLGVQKDAPEMHVALKIPSPDLLPEQRELFLREAEAARLVSHPNVVHVVDWGSDPPFIAFEYISGTTLDKVISSRQGERRLWSTAELLAMFRQLVAAMAAINERVVHRDLKPANIFLDDKGDLKISDFGISKFVGEATRSRTFKGWGSLPYMAPETWRQDRVDWQADQYSLGIVLYELVTLQRPFVGNAEELERKHLYERPKRLTELVPDIPARLGTLVARMLEKLVKDRFPSWQEIAEELDRIDQATRPEAEAVRDDDIARLAAIQIEQVRSRELEQRRVAEERNKKERGRRELLDFWAGEFFGKVRSRVNTVNNTLGEQALQLVLPPAAKDGRRKCEVSFFHAKLVIWLEALPLDGAEDMVLWGAVDLATNKRIWLGNIYLMPEPVPYGSWLEVDMRMSALVPYDRTLEDGDGADGRYKVKGDNRLVLAENWQGLASQRKLKNTMSSVNYAEKPLDFDRVLEECLEILVNDASMPPREEPRDNGGARVRVPWTL